MKNIQEKFIDYLDNVINTFNLGIVEETKPLFVGRNACETRYLISNLEEFDEYKAARDIKKILEIKDWNKADICFGAFSILSIILS